MPDRLRPIDERFLYAQVVRHFLDGASADWIQAHHSVDLATIETGWAEIIGMLEQTLQVERTTPVYFQLPDALADRRERCLRLLLEWQEHARQAIVLADAEKSSGEHNENDAGDALDVDKVDRG